MNDEIKDWKFFVPRPWYNEPTWPVEIASHSTSDMFLHKEKRVILHKLLYQSNLAMALSHVYHGNFKPQYNLSKNIEKHLANDNIIIQTSKMQMIYIIENLPVFTHRKNIHGHSLHCSHSNGEWCNSIMELIQGSMSNWTW